MTQSCSTDYGRCDDVTVGSIISNKHLLQAVRQAACQLLQLLSTVYLPRRRSSTVGLSLPQGRIAFRPTGRPLTYLSVNDCYYLRWQPVHPLWMMLGLIDCTAEIARELKERRCFHIVWRWEELSPAYLSWIYCCFRALCEFGVSSKRRYKVCLLCPALWLSV